MVKATKRWRDNQKKNMLLELKQFFSIFFSLKKEAVLILNLKIKKSTRKKVLIQYKF
jgi:hypothetical protein